MTLKGMLSALGGAPAKPFKRPEGKKYILLIEDDKDLMEMYKTKLENEGFFVLISQDGKQGLRDIRDTRPDLVLLDILMPVKDGFDVLEEKGRCSIPGVKEIPAIVLTNLASPDDQAEGKRLGAKDWWIKAYNTPAEVAEKVKKFLSKQK
ncbi:MAG: response regulator [bacterium]|nr:response regulator [bacterium]